MVEEFVRVVFGWVLGPQCHWGEFPLCLYGGRWRSDWLRNGCWLCLRFNGCLYAWSFGRRFGDMLFGFFYFFRSSFRRGLLRGFDVDNFLDGFG